MANKLKHWIDSGEPYVWLNAGAVSLSIIMVVGLIALIAVHGLGHFWPDSVARFDYQSDDEVVQIIGEIVDTESVPAAQAGLSADQAEAPFVERHLVKTGNRDYFGLDFRWVIHDNMQSISYPEELIVVERREWGNFYGYLRGIKNQW